MVPRKVAIAATAASLLLAAMALNAAAGDFDRKYNVKFDIVGGGGLPTVLPGIGTYAGSISAVRVPKNGIYFAVDRSRAPGAPLVRRAPKVRIIEVSDIGDEACSYEAGVCVIRPRQN